MAEVREEALPAPRDPPAAAALPPVEHLPLAQPPPAAALPPAEADTARPAEEAAGESPPVSDARPEPQESPAGGRAASAAAAAAERLVEEYVRRLTLKQKVGQRFIAWISGTEVSERSRRLIQEGGVGAILLQAENVKSREQLKRLTAGLQELAGGNDPPIGLLIGIDQEGGRVSRIRLDGVTRFPAPYAWGEHEDPQYIEAAAYVLNREILDLGCNFNFAPVLDLYRPPAEAVIGDRAMSREPRQVGLYGIAYLDGAWRAGVAPVAKHFPGHGATAVDSHRDLPVVDMGAEELLDRDAIPFRMAMEHGLEALMTAHILYPQLDPDYPATLSRPILQGLLRERLGFGGVVVSDAIGMGALRNHFSTEEILSGCLLAGVDLILDQNPQDTLRLEESVIELVRRGRIPETVIDEGLRRVLRWKLKYGLLPDLDDRPGTPGAAERAGRTDGSHNGKGGDRKK